VNNYDPIARYYDLLSRLFFGRTEIEAQVALLAFMPPGSRMLIVGGGTGWILEEIADRYPGGLRITYVELSGAMMRLARRRRVGASVVSFVELPVEEFVAVERYDCILTGFVFDNFSGELAGRVMRRLCPMLEPDGHWLFADFHYRRQESRFWQGLMLRTMYFSARLICKVDAKELPDMDGLFAQAGLAPVHVSWYYRGFIKAVAYRRGRS
jgi:ubiquinone/menaquinone biosynthesis C-methylase UbiE